MSHSRWKLAFVTVVICSCSGASRNATNTIAIASFAAVQPEVAAGTSTQLVAIFSGGTAMVDQGVGPVTSGTPTNTSTLTADTTFTLTVTGPDGSTAVERVTVATVAPPSVSSLLAATSKVTAGDGTTITAVFSGGAGAVDHGVGPVLSGVPFATGDLSSDTVFTLTVQNSVGVTATSSVPVTVSDAPVISSFTPATAIVTAGDSTTLAPDFSGGVGAVDPLGVATSGFAMDTGPLFATTTYSLVVTNEAGATTTASATVTVVDPAVATSLAPLAAIITAGTATTLMPTFSGGTGVVTNDQDGTAWPVATGQAIAIAPTVTTAYGLTVTNAAGASATTAVTVTVVPPPVITSFTAVKTIVSVGDLAMLSATFTGASSAMMWSDCVVGACMFYPDVHPSFYYGFSAMEPATTSYTLVVSNAAGTSAQAMVTVKYVARPTASLVASPSALPAPGITTLSGTWTGQSAVVSSSGSAPAISVASSPFSLGVWVPGTTAYTLVVTNEAGDVATSTAVVTVP